MPLKWLNQHFPHIQLERRKTVATRRFRIRQLNGEQALRRNLMLLSMVGIFGVYLAMGAAAFLFFEHSFQEQSLTRFQFNLMFNRQQFARQMSTLIFNDTKNMVVIMDRQHSKQIHENLMKSLKDYERRFIDLHAINEANGSESTRNYNLNLPPEWNICNSLIYAWSLLTTIGTGTNLTPRTFSGQLFAMLYCLLGVPFYVLTMITLAYRFFDYVGRNYNLSSGHHLIWLFSVISIYVIWLAIFSLILYSNFISESIWRAVFTAVFSSLTIQTNEFNALGPAAKLLVLSATTVSLFLSIVTVFFLIGFYRGRFRVAAKKQHFQSSSILPNASTTEQKVHPEKVKISSPIVTTHQSYEKLCHIHPKQRELEVCPMAAPRFQIIVDELGDAILDRPPNNSNI